MRIVVDVNHPGHVHFFKNFIWESRKLGHEVLITASDKDITLDLLNDYNFEYIKLGSYGKGLARKMVNLFVLDWKMYKAIRNFKPDVCMGIASARAAHAAFVIPGAKSYIFDDTEHSMSKIWVYLPFATKIVTPDCFSRTLCRETLKYAGFHELAYLHPDYFKPDSSILKDLGLKEDDIFFVLRFVAWDATHDIGHKGFTNKGKLEMLNELEKHGRVFITSETPLPSEFEKYRISVSPTRIHDLMYYASMYVGEGGTMASESAILGTPSILVNDLNAGSFMDLEHNYNLMRRFSNDGEALACVKEMLAEKDIKKLWNERRQKMLANKVNVTRYMLQITGAESPAVRKPE